MRDGGRAGYDGDTKRLKKQIRVVSKVICCIAGVFLIAPVMSFNGFMWMAGSVVVFLISALAHGWSEPDEDPEELKP